jgi:hypothetical protein
MRKNKTKHEHIPQNFSSLDEASEFWDSHNLADYWNETSQAIFDVKLKEHSRYVVVEENLAKKLSRVSKKEKVSPETLVNLWVAEKLATVA